MMNTISTDLDEAIKADLAEIDFKAATTVPLSDLIRIGANHTEQALGWGEGDKACALAAAGLAAKNLGLI